MPICTLDDDAEICIGVYLHILFFSTYTEKETFSICFLYVCRIFPVFLPNKNQESLRSVTLREVFLAKKLYKK